MSIRIPALFLAAGSLALWNNPWIALAIVAGSIPIPWIAVIGANDRPPLPKGQARTYTAGRLSSNTPYALPPGLTGTDAPSGRAGARDTATDAAPDTPADRGAPTPPTDESDPEK